MESGRSAGANTRHSEVWTWKMETNLRVFQIKITQYSKKTKYKISRFSLENINFKVTIKDFIIFTFLYRKGVLPTKSVQQCYL
jgi:uncharacterized protein YaeQ